MKTFSQFSLSALMALSLAACHQAPSNSQWRNFDEQRPNLEPVNNEAGLVVYRLDDKQPKAVRVLVNNEYFTALQLNGFSQAKVCAKNTPLLVKYVDENDKASAKQPQSQVTAKLLAKQVHYFRVEMKGGEPVLVEVEKAQAQTELAQTKHQANTISRVSNLCAVNVSKK